MRPLKVLSLFDGIGAARIAFDRLDIPVEYYASEIDTHCIQVSTENYPDIIQLGDVKDWNTWDLSEVDMLIGGTPCQGFSYASPLMLNFTDPRSSLFFDFVNIKKALKPKHFLMENVRMKAEWEDVISQYLQAAPIEINSNLVSAQNRRRLYWSDTPLVHPKDLNITWGDIRQNDCADEPIDEKYFFTEKTHAWVEKHISWNPQKTLRTWGDHEKCQMIEASHGKGVSGQRFFGIEEERGLRYITPLECERAQTIPDNYTASVAKTRRYSMIGNSFTVDVIKDILEQIFINPRKMLEWV